MFCTGDKKLEKKNFLKQDKIKKYNKNNLFCDTFNNEQRAMESTMDIENLSLQDVFDIQHLLYL